MACITSSGQGVRGDLHWRTWAVWQMSRCGVQGCVWLGHCTDPSVPRTNCSGWRSEAAQEQLLCCSCAVSAKRGDAGEVEREVHGCWSTAEGQRLALGRGILAGFCPSHHHLGIVAWLGSSAQDLEIRNVQSALMTPQCVLPLLAGAGNGTEDTVAWCGPPVFLTSSCQPGDWAETFSAQMQEPFITFSALHLAATASQRALGGGNDLASGNGDLFQKVLYCNIFLLSDCAVEASHSYHAGSSWGSLILFFLNQNIKTTMQWFSHFPGIPPAGINCPPAVPVPRLFTLSVCSACSVLHETFAALQ